MKLNKQLFFIPILISICIGCIASINLFTNKGFSFHDESQIAYLFEYTKTINLGQFPPRWAPDMHFTYGSPYLEFNYQLPYYLGTIFHNIGFSLLNSYKLILALSFVIGSIGMFLLGSAITGPVAGLAASFLFTFTPYRSVDVFVRGTIGESLAIGIYPWIVLALFRLKNKPNYLNIIYSAISISALILTHQPATVFGLPIILGIFILSELILKNYKFLLNLLIAGIISFGLSSYYLVPVLLEQKLIFPVSPFNFYDHFPFIWQLIYSKWGYGSSNWGPYDDLSFQMGFANLVAVILGIIFVFIAVIRKNIIKNTYILSTTVAIGFIFFFMNQRSTFLWNIFPYTNSIQFPWRLLAIMALVTSIQYLFLLKNSHRKFRKILLIAIPLIALINNFSYFHPGTIVEHADSYYLRRYLPTEVLLPGEKVSKDYLNFTEESIPLPKTAIRPTAIPESTITATQPETSIIIKGSNPFSTVASIESSTGDFVTVNKFYYPGWVVKLDDKIQKISLNQYGAMTIFVSKGNHILNVSYKNTLIRYLGNIISIISIIGMVSLLIYNSKLNRAKRI